MNPERRDFFKRPVLMIIVGLIVTIVVAAVTLLVLLALDPKSSSDRSTTNTNSGGAGSGGTALQGNVRGLIGNVSSTRNLAGLTLRINQLDVCQLPELTAYIAAASDSGTVSQLEQRDVEVFVDGKKIKSVQLSKVNAAQQPLNSVLVVDRSGSMAGAPIENAKTAAASYVNKLVQNDQVSVMQFDHQVQTLVPMTADKGAALGVIGQIGVRGDTALYDAISQGVGVANGCARKAVIVLSDGGDTASKTQTLDSAVNVANKAGLAVFVVGLKGETYDAGVLKSITDRTGGQLFETDDPAQLSDLYSRVDQQLKGQYYVRIKLEGVEKTGGEHRIKIMSTVGGSPAISERSFIY